jgi:hypothetical protein
MNRIKVNIPIGTSGKWSIRKATGDSNTIYTDILGSPCGGKIEPYDDYTFLFHDDIKFVMSDTYSEYAEHQPLWSGATGDVLIAGLGVGYVNEFLMNNENVTSITIIEKNQDVIDLVWPYCPKNGKFTLINEDIENWTLPNNSHWHFGWFDSWTSESNIDSYQSYQQFIQNKYQTHCDSIRFWSGE